MDFYPELVVTSSGVLILRQFHCRRVQEKHVKRPVGDYSEMASNVACHQEDKMPK